MSKESKRAYDNAFIRDNYDNIVLRVPKGKREDLKELAQTLNKSVNELIIDALEKQYGIFIKKF